MKKLIFAQAALLSLALLACSEDSGTSASSGDCSLELSKSCLKGTWLLTDISGTSGNAGKGTLKFSGSKYTYTPAVADANHTYCPGNLLSGSFEITDANEITFSIEGFKFQDCFPYGSKTFSSGGTTKITQQAATAVMNAEGTTLRLTGVSASVFVPNDEGGKTEIYTKQ